MQKHNHRFDVGGSKGYIKDGRLYRHSVGKNGEYVEELAVLYSPGWGSQWSTAFQEENMERAMFCPEVVLSVLFAREDSSLVFRHVISQAKEQFPDEYISDRLKLCIGWVPSGKRFRLREYDGDEWVEIYNKKNWYKA